MSIKNDGHYFCRAGGNRPDGLNEPVTYNPQVSSVWRHFCRDIHRDYGCKILSPG
ncbi:hypothetical protein GQ042_004655 [Salmonella enterica]|nr:hypothetical protein [Salmonella enterica]